MGCCRYVPTFYGKALWGVVSSGAPGACRLRETLSQAGKRGASLPCFWRDPLGRAHLPLDRTDAALYH